MRRLMKFFAATAVAAALACQPLSPARADVIISIAPPILPIYSLPRIPGPDYIWSPGYWAYDDDVADYYWVPGTWVLAPRPGLLWTPGYWAFGDSGYYWHAGYWGPHVGFYGGINYGFGYGGYGYEGGRWDNGRFFYNTTVYRVDRTVIKNVYVKNVTIINNTTKVSFNGGNGGTTAKPNTAEEKAASESHIEATTTQTDHQKAARSDRALFVSTNHGKPAIAATPKAGTFSGKGVIASKGSKPVATDKASATSSGAGPTGESKAASSGKHHDGAETKSGAGASQKGSNPNASASTGNGTASGSATGHKDHKTAKFVTTPNSDSGSKPAIKSAAPKPSKPEKNPQSATNNAVKSNIPHAQNKPHNAVAAHTPPKKNPDQKQQ